MLQLIVHRGTNIKCPENSICGIDEIRELTANSIIEIDIVPTKDNKLVLFHDFTLARLCNIDKMIFDFTLSELNEIQNKYQFIELSEVLKLFPSQKFLLDIRCSFHEDYFLESNIKINQIKMDLFEKYFFAFKNLNIKNIILSCSSIKMATRFKKKLSLDVELSENCTREFIDDIEQNKSLNIEFSLKKINIQSKFLTPSLVSKLHNQNIKVYSTPSMKRTIENSNIMLNKAKECKCDGIWLSPIDKEIIRLINE